LLLSCELMVYLAIYSNVEFIYGGVLVLFFALV
jgi:hypothetical protein